MVSNNSRMEIASRIRELRECADAKAEWLSPDFRNGCCLPEIPGCRLLWADSPEGFY